MSKRKTITVNLNSDLLKKFEEVVGMKCESLEDSFESALLMWLESNRGGKEPEHKNGSRVREVLKEEEYYLKKLRNELLELNDLCWILDYETPELYNKYTELDSLISARLQEIEKKIS